MSLPSSRSAGPRLENRVAIVTGGGRGIGRAICLEIAKEGAHVVVAARGLNEIERVASEIRDLGQAALAIVTDVSDEHSVSAMVNATLRTYGRIDILVNNAGITHLSCPVAEFDCVTWEKIISVNLTGGFLCSRAVLTTMIAQQSGKIINVSSIRGRRGAAGRSAYAASKAAILNLTESLSEEVKRCGINVNAICPGAVDTRMMQELSPGREPSTMIAPEDIARVAVFLASADAKSIHGAIIDIFGNITG